MSEQQHVRADGTVTFLPHRLNRHPVVVRGLTADELWICCGLSGAAGLLVGAPLSWVFRTIAIAPTFVVLGVALGVFIGGGILLGAAALLLLDRGMPHEHFIKGLEGPAARTMRRTWLFVIAIALHNIPEGLAIGVAFGSGDSVRASALATGIAIQDVPEGLVVAVALLSVGYSRWFAAGLGVLSGLTEPVAAVLGASVVTVSASLLPWGLAFAAGAMLFVISHEMIPESHRKGHESFATAGLMIGFVVMMTLDTALA